MSKPNPHWQRWIVSSIAEYFKTNVATPLNLAYLVEGIHDRDDSFEHASDRAEVRINGPFTKELAKNCWRIWVDINILVTSNLDGAKKNRYTLDINVGKFHQWMDTCIPIKKFGALSQTPENDGSLLGVLYPRSDKNDSIRAIHFGQVNKEDRLKQSVVDGRYVMYLNTD
jgi:hypothetical protein